LIAAAWALFSATCFSFSAQCTIVRQQRHAVADADALGAHRARGEEDLGRRRVRELGQEVVLDRPGAAEAGTVGRLHLLERLPEVVALRGRAVGKRDLDLVEQIDLHEASEATQPL
jgi:hypothetical protein